MFCKSCGQQLNDVDKFCPACGTYNDLVTTVKEAAATYDDNTLQPNVLKQPVSLNTKRQLTIGGIIVAIVFVFFFTLRAFNGPAILKELKAKFTNSIEKHDSASENIITSKENYNLGQKQFNDKKYLEALDSFKKVIKEDTENYNDAQDKIIQCRKIYSDANFPTGVLLTAEVKEQKIPVVLRNLGENNFQAPGTDLYLIVSDMNGDNRNPGILFKVYKADGQRPIQSGQLSPGQIADIQGLYKITFEGFTILKKAKNAADDGQYNTALEYIEQALKFDPNNEEALKLKNTYSNPPLQREQTNTLSQQNENTLANLNISPSKPLVTNDYKNFKSRVDNLNQQVKTNPNDIGLQQDLGNAYYDLASAAQQIAPTEATEDFNQAIIHYQNVLKTKKDINVLTDMATAAFYAGQSDLAGRTFKEALALQPDFVQALLNYGIFLSEVKQDYTAAIGVWQKALEKNQTGPNAGRLSQLISEAKNNQSK